MELLIVSSSVIFCFSLHLLYIRFYRNTRWWPELEPENVLHFLLTPVITGLSDIFIFLNYQFRVTSPFKILFFHEMKISLRKFGDLNPGRRAPRGLPFVLVTAAWRANPRLCLTGSACFLKAIHGTGTSSFLSLCFVAIARVTSALCVSHRCSF